MKNVKSEGNEVTMKNIILALVWVIVLGGSIFISNKLLAHTDLAEAIPGGGAIMREGPEHVTLRFTEEVRLLGFSMSGVTSNAVEIDFEPSTNMENEFSIIIPTLAADSYTVEWVVMGGDSHRVEGAFSFTVDPTANEIMGANNEMPAHDDTH